MKCNRSVASLVFGVACVGFMLAIIFMPDAHASAHGHHWLYGAEFALATGIDNLRAQYADLRRQSFAKIGDLKDGLSKTDLARIEAEHTELLEQMDSVKMAIENEERNGRGSNKAWASEFYASAATSGLGIGELHNIVMSSGSREQAVARLTDAMHAGDRDKPAPYGGHLGLRTLDNPGFAAAASVDALYALITGKQIDGPGREMASGGVRRVIHSMAAARGVHLDPFMSTAKMMDRYFASSGSGMHTTSDFPSVLGLAFNKVLLEAYQPATSALLTLARPRDVPDFNDITLVRLSAAAKLNQVIEGGEIKSGTRADAKEKYKVGTFAGMFAISRQALVNDQLGAFNDPVRDYGRAAAGTLADELAALLNANSGDGPDLDDGSPVYATARGNKAGSGGAIDVDTLGAGRAAMRTLKDIDGKTIINVTPKYLLVGSAKETEAEKVLHTLSAVQVSDVNPFGGALSLAVEPRLSGNSWRLFPDPAQLPCIEVAYLNGARAPFIETREGWNVLGTEFRVVFDFGTAMIDSKTYLNPGN